MTARLEIVQIGQVRSRPRSTVSLLIDGDHIVIVDPGMAPSQSAILDPLERSGIQPHAVTDVVISHHHPDHTMNVGLFPEARLHDYWATYHHDTWISRSAEGFEVSPSVTTWLTPGHTREDITTVVETADGVVALTHLWWTAEGPLVDPHASDQRLIEEGRARVLDSADLIVPGHGEPFAAADAPSG